MLTLTRSHWLEMLAEAWRAYPLEGCGVLIGHPGGSAVERFVPVPNAAASSRVYQLDGAAYARAAMDADDDGLDLIGVMHSHTHTVAYPSPTDVAEATKPLVPPTWHWVIVGLGWGLPELHSFRIGPSEGSGSGITEEEVRLSS